VFNSAGRVVSDAATLTVSEPSDGRPYLTTHPVSRSVVEGTDVTFTAEAGGTPAPSVQWQVKAAGTDVWADIAGATSTTLLVEAAALELSGNQYKAVFTNDKGSIESDIATLTVTETPAPPPDGTETYTVVDDSGRTITYTAPTEVVYGEDIVVTGTGWLNTAGTEGSVANVVLDARFSGDAGTVYTKREVISPVDGSVIGDKRAQAHVLADAQGNWTVTIPFPTAANAALSDGSWTDWEINSVHQVRFLTGSLLTGDVVRSLAADFTVVAPPAAETYTGTSDPSVTYTAPTVLAYGSDIVISGTGWKSTDGSRGSAIAVKIDDGAVTTTRDVYNPVTGALVAKDIHVVIEADASGNWTATIPFPTPDNSNADWQIGDTHLIRLLTGSMLAGADKIRTEYANFTVTEATTPPAPTGPVITLDKAAYAPGDTVTVTATGFEAAAGQRYRAQVNQGISAYPSAQVSGYNSPLDVTISDSGEFSLTLTVQDAAFNGEHPLRVSAWDNSVEAFATITVAGGAERDPQTQATANFVATVDGNPTMWSTADGTVLRQLKTAGYFLEPNTHYNVFIEGVQGSYIIGTDTYPSGFTTNEWGYGETQASVGKTRADATHAGAQESYDNYFAPGIYLIEWKDDDGNVVASADLHCVVRPQASISVSLPDTVAPGSALEVSGANWFTKSTANGAFAGATSYLTLQDAGGTTLSLTGTPVVAGKPAVLANVKAAATTGSFSTTVTLPEAGGASPDVAEGWYRFRAISGSYYTVLGADDDREIFSDWFAVGTPSAPAPVAVPAITSLPQHVTVQAGNSTTLEVEASGDGLSYQWQTSGNKTVWTDAETGGAATAAWTLGTESADANTYLYARVLVSNSSGTVRSEPVLIEIKGDGAGGPLVMLAETETEQNAFFEIWGSGWLNPDGTPMTIAVKLDDGAYTRTEGNAVADSEGDLSIWAIIESDASGNFRKTLRTPTGAAEGAWGSTPAYTPGFHRLTLVTGVLDATDAPYTVVSGRFNVSAVDSTPTVAVAQSAEMGSTLHISGTNWFHPNGSGSTIGVKIDEGAYSHTAEGSVNPNLTVWAVIEVDVTGAFEIDMPLPDGTTDGANGSTPALTTGEHTLRFLTGSLKAGDTMRSIASESFTVIEATTPPVGTAPVVITQPQSASVEAGAVASFTAAASGDPAPTVQWYTRLSADYTWADIAGATSATLSLPAVTLAQSGSQYYAVFTNDNGIVESDIATLTVTAGSTPPPATETYTVTDSAGRTITYTAPTEVAYGSDITVTGTGWLNTAGTAGSVANVVLDARFSGDTTTVYTTREVISPVTGIVIGDKRAQAHVQADAQGNWSVTIPFPTADNAQLADGSWANWEIGSTHQIRFLTGSLLSGDVARTLAADFTITAPAAPPASAPVVTTQPVSQSVAVGAQATFTAAATGNPAPTVQWYARAAGESTWASIAGATSATLLLDAAVLEWTGSQYKAVFTNDGGITDTEAATLTVTDGTPPPSGTAPVVTLHPVSQTVAVGATATFTAAATGDPTPSVKWQYFNGTVWADIVGANSTTLTVTNAAASFDGRQYRAYFENSAGWATTNGALITVTGGSGATDPLPAGTTLDVDTSAAAIGGVVHLSGTGWMHPDGSGSIIAVKINDGAFSRTTEGKVHDNLTIWAIIETDASGSFEYDLVLPDGTEAGAGGSTPAFGDGEYTLRFLTGSLKTGDVIRTWASAPFVVGQYSPVGDPTPIDPSASLTGALSDLISVAFSGNQTVVTIPGAEPGDWVNLSAYLGSSVRYPWGQDANFVVDPNRQVRVSLAAGAFDEVGTYSIVVRDVNQGAGAAVLGWTAYVVAPAVVPPDDTDGNDNNGGGSTSNTTNNYYTTTTNAGGNGGTSSSSAPSSGTTGTTGTTGTGTGTTTTGSTATTGTGSTAGTGSGSTSANRNATTGSSLPDQETPLADSTVGVTDSATLMLNIILIAAAVLVAAIAAAACIIVYRSRRTAAQAGI
jgi:hypothetical protein